MISPSGVTIRRSHLSVSETIDVFQTFLQQHGVTVYARIDQEAEAKKAGLTLSPLQFILFGNPTGGVPLMSQNPLAALDLPLKLIAWEDAEHLVWIAYNEAAYLEARYSLPHNPVSPLNMDHLVNEALGL